MIAVVGRDGASYAASSLSVCWCVYVDVYVWLSRLGVGVGCSVSIAVDC